MYYSVENDLMAWHVLCRIIGVEPLLKIYKQCKEVGDCTIKVGRFMLI
jgi:hypothetical protein